LYRQNYDYELNQIFFDDLGQNHFFLNAAGASATETIGQILKNRSLLEVKIQMLLVLGDVLIIVVCVLFQQRNDTFLFFHMEAGNRRFNQRVLEETNRKIADHISMLI
jgi:UDP-N-acetylglucosamine 2-epimerase (non-hydrolysing)